jgi:hypothetical protein
VSRVTPRSAAAGDVTERELQVAAIALARSLGWGTSLSARKALLVQVEELRVEAPPLDGLVFHPKWSIGSEPGWPDLTLIRARDRRLVFAELKTEKGRIHPRQAEVLELLASLAINGWHWEAPLAEQLEERGMDDGGTRIEVYIWRPSDLASGAIAEVLR